MVAMRCFRSGLSFAPFLLWVLHHGVYSGAHASSPLWSWDSTSYSFDDDYSYSHLEYPACPKARGTLSYIRDGYCDGSNNNEECGYDGGDCCICTCEDTEDFSCGSYYCLDPDVSEECREESNPSHQRSSSTSDDASSQFPGCSIVGGNARRIGDGYCNIDNSNEECGYDGGDCCICTCIDTPYHACGSNGGYYCKDPSVSAECMEESSSYIEYLSSTTGYRFSQYPGCFEVGGWAPNIGDGRCDYRNSVEECAYDGGDCCSCTCADSDITTCGENGYLCRDPSVSADCRDESTSYTLSLPSSSYGYQAYQYPNCAAAGGHVTSIGNAYCYRENNIEECGYDGGDCCVCTCENTVYSRCGEDVSFDCLDPSVSPECVEESEAFLPPGRRSPLRIPTCYLEGGILGLVHDGHCDSMNNIEECGYDGGDCCTCTCVDTTENTCGEDSGFLCLDPKVSTECKNESASYGYILDKYPGCHDVGGWTRRIGDGNCDLENSNEECAYDGGDCCSCTCVDTEENECGANGGYYCRDPSVSTACKEESASYINIVSSTYLYRFNQYPGCYEVGGDASGIGDGACDRENNNEECAYDGGDCCSCTCDSSVYSSCGYYGYDCRDPEVSTACKDESASNSPSSST